MHACTLLRMQCETSKGTHPQGTGHMLRITQVGSLRPPEIAVRLEDGLAISPRQSGRRRP